MHICFICYIIIIIIFFSTICLIKRFTLIGVYTFIKRERKRKRHNLIVKYHFLLLEKSFETDKKNEYIKQRKVCPKKWCSNQKVVFRFQEEEECQYHSSSLQELIGSSWCIWLYEKNKWWRLPLYTFFLLLPVMNDSLFLLLNKEYMIRLSCLLMNDL